MRLGQTLNLMRVTFHETEKDTETHRESHVQTEPMKLLPVKGCWETPEAARSKALELYQKAALRIP